VAPKARIVGVFAPRLRRLEVEATLQAQAEGQYAGLQLGNSQLLASIVVRCTVMSFMVASVIKSELVAVRGAAVSVRRHAKAGRRCLRTACARPPRGRRVRRFQR
jgi:hypothetical protein